MDSFKSHRLARNVARLKRYKGEDVTVVLEGDRYVIRPVAPATPATAPLAADTAEVAPAARFSDGFGLYGLPAGSALPPALVRLRRRIGRSGR